MMSLRFVGGWKRTLELTKICEQTWAIQQSLAKQLQNLYKIASKVENFSE
jgi:hypothetical protein